MSPPCAPNMAGRQRSANGSSVARRPIAADGRFMSNGSCLPSARTRARTSVSRRTRAMDAASQPGPGTAMTQANAPHGAPAGREQFPSQQNNARRRSRFKKPGRNAGKSLLEHKKPRLPVLPMSIAIGRNVWRGHTGNSRKKGAATTRKSVVLARQGPMKNQATADRQARQNHLAGASTEGAEDPQEGALAAKRDALCALSAAG
jgi:hypothetical protein